MECIKQKKGSYNNVCSVKTANQLIKEYLHTNGISKTALGKKLTPALKQQAIWKVLEKNDLDTGFVMQPLDMTNIGICEGLLARQITALKGYFAIIFFRDGGRRGGFLVYLFAGLLCGLCYLLVFQWVVFRLQLSN